MADELNKIRNRYLKLLVEQPPFFINKGYTLEQFAVDLGTNRSYASKFTNMELGVTFPVLLNKLRIAHFLSLKNEKPASRIKELAEACGFKSSFAFRRAFKRIYGTSPSEYLKNKE